MTTRPDFSLMVETVIIWFLNTGKESRREFLDTPHFSLSMWNSSLGRKIRNHFGLWDSDWEPDIKEGFDYSPDHPEAVSMKVIKVVWDILKGKKCLDQ